MEHSNKSSWWLWRMKSSSDKVTVQIEDNKPNQDQLQIRALLRDKKQLENELKSLSNKLSSALSDCKVKDGLIEKHSTLAQEAMEGRDKAEAKVDSLKLELDGAIRERDLGNEMSIHLDVALKECMQQLCFVREEQERRIHDAILKTSSEFEKSQLVLKEKLAETTRMLAKMNVENTNISKALLLKEKMIDDMNKQKTRAEAEYAALMSSLEATEKDNASMKYEVRVLGKELEIRNEEKEFNRRAADVAHKQHLESAKKIAKLESECQRLRVMVRKRLPGPAALARMKSEAEIIGRESFDMRRRKSNPSLNGSTPESAPVDSSPDIPDKKINFLTEKLCAMEEENRTLTEALTKKANELQLSRSMYAHTASKLSQVESHLDELSRGKTVNVSVPSGSNITSHDLSLVSTSDIGSDDKVSCAESWASALISELEHFKHEKQKGPISTKSVGTSDLSLMDDFVEMERLAIVLSDKGSPQFSSTDTNENVSSLDLDLNGYASEVKGKEIVPVSVASDHGAKSLDKSSLAKNSHLSITDKGKLALGKSLCKIIELLEGITILQHDHSTPDVPSGYTARVFQWKTSELTALLQTFVHACYELLNGESDVAKFAQELSSALEWIINHCFSLQDVSCMRDAIMKQFAWDESRIEIDGEVGAIRLLSGVEKSTLLPESSPLTSISSLNGHQNHLEEAENNELTDNSINVESVKKDLEERLELADKKSELLMSQLQEAEKTIDSLQSELQTVKGSMQMMESQTENHRLMNGELDLQLSATTAEIYETQKKLSSLEEELENETRPQLERTTQKEFPESELHQQEKQLQTDLEITAASEKLAECQDTILNLRKQLKALAPQTEAAMPCKVISTPSTNNAAEAATTTAITTSIAPRKPKKELINQRSSLLDRMLADDTASKAQCNVNSDLPVTNETIQTLEDILIQNDGKRRDNSNEISSFAVVPSNKKGGGNLWKKLWSKKKTNCKKPPHLLVTC